MDDEFNLYEPGAVVVSGDSILAVGRQEEIQNAYQAENLLDCQERSYARLINAHTHVPMTLLRGLADDLGWTYG